MRARVPRRDATARVAGPGIEAGGCTSRIRRPYKTTGFAPRVLYSAFSSSCLEPPSLVAFSLLRPHRHRRPACIRATAAVKLAPAL